jgi:hypothetical protein
MATHDPLDKEAALLRELVTLDDLQGAVIAKALGGDLQAIWAVLKVMDRRSKLLGLDAPEKQEVQVASHDASTIDQEVARLIAMLNGS